MRTPLYVLAGALPSMALVACSGGAPTTTTPPAPTVTATAAASAAPETPESPEPHLAELRQLTFGGENAEAYWAFSGSELIMQSRTGDMQCDQIYRMNVADPSKKVQVSNGKGATTCSYFLPGDQDVIYASTHLGGDACPPRPDMSHGYTWALYDTYDIFKAKADGSGVVRLTDTKGYDAEGTVCKKDGSIIFTSVRDGDIDLYRMDADGKNVKRLTNTPGYDGGAFFSDDCTKIVWRASRPAPGKELEDFQSLLKKGLVRPTKLELMVANADGSDPVQVTYLGAASFGPYFTPDKKRILFSSNYGDPKGREFDIWAVNVDGTHLERITNTPGFDGFPIFSPDGKYLAFSSNRASAAGSHDTNVFVAKWIADVPASKKAPEPTSADRTMSDVEWLADPAREGRGVGTKGLDDAGAFIEDRMKKIGLAPAAGPNGYRQPFDVTMEIKGTAMLEVDGAPIADASPLAFSSPTKGIDGELVLAGYGIQTDKRDDYKGLDVKGKIAVVRRFVPDGAPFDTADAKRRHGDLRRKAWVAREKGAIALIVVDLPVKPAGGKMPDEAKAPHMSPDAAGDAGIPVLYASRTSFGPIVAKLEKKQKVTAKLSIAMAEEKKPAFNVLGRLAAKGDKKPGVIVVGAHYDHLGKGGYGSLAPGEEAIHPGADDNASGTATMLEAARLLAADAKLGHDVVFISFSGEERGVIGSNYLVKNPPPGLDPKDIFAMVNLDMVGHVRSNKLDVIGYDTATEFADLVKSSCGKARIDCSLAEGGGYGPSDHASFYGAGVPVLFLFSGTHADYHKPSDTPDKINAAGMGQTAALVRELVTSLDGGPAKLSYQKKASPPPHGDPRSFGASLGTVPDYAGSDSAKGVLLAGVRPGGAAEKAGMKRGDVLVKVGKHAIGSVEDLMFVLGEAKPGEKAKATVMRDGKKVELDIQFQESKAPR
jgi:Tol biopolymer transport system component